MDGYEITLEVHLDLYETIPRPHTLVAASKLIGVTITPDMVIANAALEPEETRVIYKKNA